MMHRVTTDFRLRDRHHRVSAAGRGGVSGGLQGLPHRCAGYAAPGHRDHFLCGHRFTEGPKTTCCSASAWANIASSTCWPKATGRSRRAMPVLSSCWMSMAERVYGADHPEVADSLGTVAMIHADVGALAEAASHLERAVEIKRSSSGPCTPRRRSDHAAPA